MKAEKACSTLVIENSAVLRKAANRKFQEYLRLSRLRGSNWEEAFMSWVVLENFRRAAMHQSFEYYELEKAAWHKEMEEIRRKAKESLDEKLS